MLAALVAGVSALALCRPYPAERLSYEAVASTRCLDRHGQRLWERPGEHGSYAVPVGLEEVAPELVLATLSSEDAAFWWHPGVDPAALLRAVWLDARERRWAYGGSTITQQLAKLLAPEPRTLGGKLREARDAIRLEFSLSKREILEQYLNRAYYGRRAHGVEAAAQRLFGKHARDLDLGESALLAILPRAPAAYDPERHPERALGRRARVLERMAARGWISAAAANEAAREPLRLVEPEQRRSAPHLIDALQAGGMLPRGAREVRLTLDLALSHELEARVERHLETIAERGASQAAVLVLDNASGDVLVMIGSRDYSDAAAHGAVNATLASRSPGSALKPFVYALALEDGATPASPLLDTPTHWRGYQPRATRGHHHGVVALRDALGSSLNVPAVRTAGHLGTERVTALLREVGLDSVQQGSKPGLTVALGSVPVPLLELADAYATLARGGEYLPHRLRLDAPREAARRVLSPESAYLITDVLSDAAARRLEFGFETPLELPFPAAAKSGTSQAFGDNVVVGYTTELTVAVWVGNFDGRPMRGLLAMQGAAPLWRDVMLRAMRGRPARAFPRPAGVESRLRCVASEPGSCERKRWERTGAEAPASSAPSAGGALDVAPSPEALEWPPLRDTRALTIQAPPDGSRYRLDPLLPRERQRLALRASSGSATATRVIWSVDGAVFAESGAPFVAHWTLAPGRHRLRATSASEPSHQDEIEIEVTSGEPP